eukprot:625984-Hanusia_phi.AAC.1
MFCRRSSIRKLVLSEFLARTFFLRNLKLKRQAAPGPARLIRAYRHSAILSPGPGPGGAVGGGCASGPAGCGGPGPSHGESAAARSTVAP